MLSRVSPSQPPPPIDLIVDHQFRWIDGWKFTYTKKSQIYEMKQNHAPFFNFIGFIFLDSAFVHNMLYRLQL